MTDRYQYRVFGLDVQSEVEFPELFERTAVQPLSDVKICLAEPEGFFSGDFAQGCIDISENNLRMAVAHTGKYQVIDGKRIVLLPAPEANTHDFRLYVLGTCFGVLLHQRGMLPMHGCGALGRSGGVIFCGDSGVGKSTLALALAKRGVPILSDDVCCLGKCQDGFSLAPSYPQIKVHENVVEHLGVKVSRLILDLDTRKYFLPINQYYHSDKCSLRAIVRLTEGNHKGFRFVEIKGTTKYSEIVNNSFRVEYVKGLNCAESFFGLSSQLANSVPFYDLLRPGSSLELDRLVDVILQQKLLD